MAAEATDAIASTLAAVPFALFGHSVGALVAFETARALERRGLQPERLFLSAYAYPGAEDHREAGAPPLSALDDEALWAELSRYGAPGVDGFERGDPGAAGLEHELRALILPAVRSDFALAETHRFEPTPRLAAPLTLLAGAEDPAAPPASLYRWREAASATETAVFEGGHFFTETARDATLTLLTERLLGAEAPTSPPMASCAASAPERAGARLSIQHGPPHEAPDQRTLHDLFEDQAARNPAAPALIGPDRTLDFADVSRDSDRLARALARRGAGRGETVAILLETSADFVVAMLAAMKTGAAYLPLEAAAPDAALAALLERVKPAALVARPDRLAASPALWPAERTASLEPGWPARLSAEEDAARRDGAKASPFDVVGPHDPAYAVASSGTTGAPKAILCPHRGAVISYWWRYRHLPYAAEEREAANVFFVWEALRPLLQGRPLYVIDEATLRDPSMLIDFLERDRITRVLFTPSLLEQILGAAERGLCGALADRLSALKIIYLNGEVVAATLAARLARLAPHVRLVNDYSISECHDVCHVDLSARAPAPGRAFAPAGAVMDGVSIYVLDEAGAPTRWGEEGEVYVGGETLALGYLGDAEEEAARFSPDPYRSATGARMFRTGDLGRFAADGALEISGRAKFLIKLRGYSIAPASVEAALTAHEAVAAAAACAVPDRETGATEALAAFLSLSERDDAAPNERGSENASPARLIGPSSELGRSLRAHLATRLPAYAIPSKLFALRDWPINPATGKLDRKRLPDPAAPLNALDEAGAAAPAPISTLAETRGRLIRLWAEVLNAAPPDEDAADFFALGGHSLTAVALTIAVRERLGVDFAVGDVFDHPEIGAMARLIHARPATARRAAPLEAPSLATPAAQPTADHAKEDPRAETAGSGAEPIAILSLAGRFAGAETESGDLEGLWRLLMQGETGLRRLSDEELDAYGASKELRARPDYVPVAGHLTDIEAFDPAAFGLSAHEAAMMDPQQRLFLESCWRALEFAGYPPRGAEALLHRLAKARGDATEPPLARIGVWAGAWLPLYLLHNLGGAAALDPGDPTGFHLAEIGSDKDYLSSRAGYLLNLTGPTLSVQTSCSTALTTIAEAVAALRRSVCEMAIAGAASLMLPRGGYLAAEGHVGSPSGAVRSFDAAADGTVFTDGVGAALLKPLKAALADGDPIIAVVRGAAIGGDGGEKAGFSAPSAKGQETVIRAALADAGVEPGAIGYIEAHGSATRLGDPIEAAALARAYAAPDRAPIAVGTLKPNIGHANIAAGFAGFAKCAMALERRALPATRGIDEPNPALGFDAAGLALQRETTPWPAQRDAAGRDRPRRAGVSSLGVGGVNAHLILEEAPPRDAPPFEGGVEAAPILLSARSAAGLERLRGAVAAAIETSPEGVTLAGAAQTLRFGRESLPFRLAIAAPSLAQAAARLRRAPLPETPAPDAAPRIAFIYPGHGAQHALMARDLHRASPPFAARFEACRALFADLFNGDPALDLAQLFEPARAEALLADPRGLQAAVFAVQCGVSAMLGAAGVAPAALAGHSLGEYAAAVEAGALGLEAAAALVAARAEATLAAPAGAMLALSGDAAQAEALIEAHSEVELSAWNGPRDLVASGPAAAIEALGAAAARAGLIAAPLATSRAFHGPMMEGPAAALRAAATRIEAERPSRAPRLPLLFGLSGGWAPAGQPIPADYWARAMRAPVRFGAMMAALASAEIDIAIEIGPGCGLSRLIKDGLGPGAETLAAMRRGAEAIDDFDRAAQTLCRLWERGADIDWDGVGAEPRGARPRRVALPGAPFERKRCWIDPPPPAPKRAAQATESRTETLLAPSERVFALGYAPTAPAEPARAGRWRWTALIDDEPTERAARPDGAAFAQSLLGALALEGDSVAALPLSAWLNDAAARARSFGPDARLLWLGGVGRAAPAQASASLRAPRAAEDLAGLCAALNRDVGPPTTLFALTAGAFAIGGETLCAVGAAQISLLLALGQETPSIAARAIDLPAPPESAAAATPTLLSELRAETLRDEPFAALRESRVWIESETPFPLSPRAAERGARRLARGGHLITGGFGRIGLALARRLARHGAPMLLVGRDPSRGAQAVGALRDEGAVIHTLAADVSTRAGAEAALAAAHERLGALTGVFHAAGLADLRYLPETDAASLAAERAPKSLGAERLAAALEATPGAAPDFVLLFSSLAARLGGLGMGAYGGANRALDLIAEGAQRGAAAAAATQWLSIAWDDWDFAYGKEQTGAYARTRAGLSLPPEEALDALEALLGAPPTPCAAVAATALAPRIERWRHGAGRAETGAVASTAPALAPSERAAPGQGRPDQTKPNQALRNPVAERAAAEATRSEIETPFGAALEAVLAAYRDTLGEPSIGVDADFFDLGGDSLLAARLAAALAALRPGRARPAIAALFDHPTPRRLAAHLSKADLEPGKNR
ncbi:MAG: SDR family NAD(P)-dependent oxidoreductase, partial [Pseudomonadota bacterium]